MPFPLTPWTTLRVERHGLDVSLALRAQGELRREALVLPVGVKPGPAEKAVEIVEAEVLRLAGLVLAAVPLTHPLGHVAGLAQQGGQRDLVSQRARLPGEARVQLAVPHRQAPGQQACSALGVQEGCE